MGKLVKLAKYSGGKFFLQSNEKQEVLFTYLLTCAVVPHGPGRASPGNVRSGMSRSHQYRIRPLSHLAAWSIWFALRVRYDARKVSLSSTSPCFFSPIDDLRKLYPSHVPNLCLVWQKIGYENFYRGRPTVLRLYGIDFFYIIADFSDGGGSRWCGWDK